MRRVAWTESAVDDLRGIVRYIDRDSPAAASSVTDRIERTVQALAATPTGRRGRVAGTYEKPVPNLPYIIAYALDLAGDRTVSVLRVIHGARN